MCDYPEHAMISILFVDDEPKVLRGIERMFFDRTDEWDMAFAQSGVEALDLLGRRDFDVVVSDMRMPEMDGAQLLHTVMQRYPHIVRIVLSGHSDRELVVRSVGETHQYLAKPCDPDRLQAIVTRACALREYMANDNLRNIISRITTIPSPPDLYLQVLEEIRDRDGSIRKVGELISRDVGMTAKILQIVNSAFFGLPRHIADPAQAVNLLGLETLKALILSSHVFAEFKLESLNAYHLDLLWNHSIATGTLAKRIANEENCSAHTCDHALMAGILHDSGKLILAANLPEDYAAMLERLGRDNLHPLKAEYDTFGTTHAEVGAYLFGLWGLPDPIVEAVAYHHHPSDCVADEFGCLGAVHVANALQTDHAYPEEQITRRLDRVYLETLGLTDRLAAWKNQCLDPTPAGAAHD